MTFSGKIKSHFLLFDTKKQFILPAITGNKDPFRKIFLLNTKKRMQNKENIRNTLHIRLLHYFTCFFNEFFT